MNGLILNQRMEVTIDGYNHRGEGVCHIQGFTVFVPFSIMNEILDIEIVILKKNYGVGAIRRIIKPSESRVAPRCPVFGICGGCQLQHIQYEDQAKVKMKIVSDVLQRIGGIYNRDVIKSIIMADHPWYYRNKAQVPVALQGGETAIGFYARGTHEIIETEECFIQNQENNEALHFIKGVIADLQISPYEEKSGKGQLRNIVLRHSAADNSIMVVLVSRTEMTRLRKVIITLLSKGITNLKSIYQNIQPLRSNVIFGKDTDLLSGDKTIRDTLGSFSFDLSPQSFFQVNPEQTEKIYNLVLEYAAPSGDDVIIDAYCGIGTISLYLAQKAKKVYGIEVVQEAIEDARANALKNGVDNVEFICGEVEDILPQFQKEGMHPHTVVVDPPRKGCEPSVIEAIAKMDVRRIVYVSCNPASLARDIHLFARYNYVVEIVQPVDQFPHTSHVETVVLMCASSEAGKC